MIKDRIRELRIQNNMTLAELARRLDISTASIKNWEKGLTHPTALYLKKMAYIFDVSVDYILEVENPRILSINGLTKKDRELLLKLIEHLRIKNGIMMV